MEHSEGQTINIEQNDMERVEIRTWATGSHAFPTSNELKLLDLLSAEHGFAVVAESAIYNSIGNKVIIKLNYYY